MTTKVRRAAVVVIGAGQAGLSAGYHLQRRGFRSALDDPNSERSFVILDAEEGPGGAWRHRWESLTMGTVNGIFDLPGFRREPSDPHESSRTAVPRYFAEFEAQAHLPVLRPVRVHSVSAIDASGRGDVLVQTNLGEWRGSAVINATGTWNSPVMPVYPGQESFTGQQLHSRDFVSAEALAGRRVAIVGGGVSAVQQLDAISRVATTFWYTRREPAFREGGFNPKVEGREVVAKVTADAEAGQPIGSIVSYTSLTWTPYAMAAKERGVLLRRPMFTAIEPEGVREADGTFTPVDTVLWATGFTPSISHLAPLVCRNDAGGVKVKGTQVVDDPRVHLIGYGPSQSTVGANRAGRDAVRALSAWLDQGSEYMRGHVVEGERSSRQEERSVQ